MGLTPHREAKAASEWRRSGLLPAAIYEEGRRRVWSYAEAIHQGWGCRPCESLDLGLQVLYLITELTVATGKGAKSILGRRGGPLHTFQAGSSWTG